MREQLDSLKNLVSIAAENPEFVHHQWYVEYHLKVVEGIAFELCDHYPTANQELVEALVWIHDYGKMLADYDTHHSKIEEVGVEVLVGLGFPKEFAEQVIEYTTLSDKRGEIDLSTEEIPIEVKILSSADGASHFVGPFYPVYGYENSDKSWKDVMEGNLRKAAMDWDKKIVLPEAKQAFEERYKLVLEQNGILPSTYLND